MGPDTLIKLTLLIFCIAQTSTTVAQQLEIRFAPVDSTFDNAVREYQTIWAAERDRIILTLEEVSGMKFTDTLVQAIVKEAPSYSGWKDDPMILRASYTPDVKKGTLVHELGHRLHASLKNYPTGINDHELLFLYLYDVYTDLYGKEFADRMVAIESTRSNTRNPYRELWSNALLMSREARQAKLKIIVNPR